MSIKWSKIDINYQFLGGWRYSLPNFRERSLFQSQHLVGVLTVAANCVHVLLRWSSLNDLLPGIWGSIPPPLRVMLTPSLSWTIQCTFSDSLERKEGHCSVVPSLEEQERNAFNRGKNLMPSKTIGEHKNQQGYKQGRTEPYATIRDHMGPCGTMWDHAGTCGWNAK